MDLRTRAYWMPFTHNRYLKKEPQTRILARPEGAYYTTVKAGVCSTVSRTLCAARSPRPPEIAEAVARQVRSSTNSPAFPDGASKIFSRRRAIVELAPRDGQGLFRQLGLGGGGHPRSRSPVAITASGEAARTRLIGRERGYHGSGLGGISWAHRAPTARCSRRPAGRRRSPAATYNAAEMRSRAASQNGAHLAGARSAWSRRTTLRRSPRSRRADAGLGRGSCRRQAISSGCRDLRQDGILLIF